MSKSLRAALYARFSTDKQSSTADQLRVCARIAEGAKFEVVRSFTDEAVSGGTTKRPGYQAMLAFVRDGHADVIVAEDTSRLWRNMAAQAPRLAELTDLRVIVVTHDLDTRQETAGMMGAVLGAGSEHYRKEIGRRTRRGLEGRALARRPTGGRAYGYIAGTAAGTGQVEINPGEAEIVRRIFRDYAEGKSPREIAASLNAEGVPSPGASWNRNGADAGGKRRDGKWQSTAIHGHAQRGTGILINPRYIGRIQWGRMRWDRSAADSSLRTPFVNAEPQHTYLDERLRIIPQDLWDRVQGRRASVHLASATIRAVRRTQRGRPSLHLLSGLFSCATCGGSFSVVDARYYGCSTHKNGGPAACSNDGRMLRVEIEENVLKIIREELLAPEAVALAVAEVRRILRDARKVAPPPQAAAPAIAAKDRELEQLRALLRAGTLSPTVAQAAISKAEDERAHLLAAGEHMQTRTADRVVRMMPDLAKRFRQMIAALPRTDLPPDELTRARGLIHSFLGGRATVEKDARGRIFARLKLDGRPLLGPAAANTDNLVAGARYFDWKKGGLRSSRARSSSSSASARRMRAAPERPVLRDQTQQKRAPRLL